MTAPTGDSLDHPRRFLDTRPRLGVAITGKTANGITTHRAHSSFKFPLSYREAAVGQACRAAVSQVRPWLIAAVKRTCAATLYVVGVCLNRIGTLPSWNRATRSSPGYAALISSHHQHSGIARRPEGRPGDIQQPGEASIFRLDCASFHRLPALPLFTGVSHRVGLIRAAARTVFRSKPARWLSVRPKTC